MVEMTNYHFTSNTYTTINTDLWHRVSVKGKGAPGIHVITDWLKTHKEGLVGGWQLDSDAIRFQKQEDVMFFKLSSHNG